jgi:hypothetical protein
MNPPQGSIVDWLMEGEPAIRWQVMRDLLDAPDAEWQAERQKTADQGWGAAFLSHQAEDGIWGGGVYSPKWISSTYTLLTLVEIGLPQNHPAARRGVEIILDDFFGLHGDPKFINHLERLDLCLVGMAAELGTYFQLKDARLEALPQHLLNTQMADGGWNCRLNRDKDVHHSSFHTTLNVLDGIRELVEQGSHPLAEQLRIAEGKALELLLEHRLFRSSRTGEIISERFLRFSHPNRWFYNIFRALEYFQRCGAARDERLSEAMDILKSKQMKEGGWPVQYRHSGLRYFDMEKTGKASRWNTLRALRILRWWEKD